MLRNLLNRCSSFETYLVDSKVVPATGGTAACRAAADRKEEDTIGVRRIVAVVELDIH